MSHISGVVPRNTTFRLRSATIRKRVLLRGENKYISWQAEYHGRNIYSVAENRGRNIVRVSNRGRKFVVFSIRFFAAWPKCSTAGCTHTVDGSIQHLLTRYR